jgi:hypothetical protein
MVVAAPTLSTGSTWCDPVLSYGRFRRETYVRSKRPLRWLAASFVVEHWGQLVAEWLKTSLFLSQYLKQLVLEYGDPLLETVDVLQQFAISPCENNCCQKKQRGLNDRR